MLMLIFKIISIAILVGIAIVVFVDSYNKDYKQGHDSLANCFVLPLFILFAASFLAMLYTKIG